METKLTFTLRMRKRCLKFLGYMIKKKGLDALSLTEHIYGKSARKQRDAYLSNLCKQMAKQRMRGTVKRQTLRRGDCDRSRPEGTRHIKQEEW